MKPIAAPIVGGVITSTIHVLILVPVFFMLLKRRITKQGPSDQVIATLAAYNWFAESVRTPLLVRD